MDRYKENHAHPSCLHTSSIAVVLTSSCPFWVICRTLQNPFSILFISTAFMDEQSASTHSPTLPLHICLFFLLPVLLSLHEGISYPSVKEYLRSHLLFTTPNIPERPVTSPHLSVSATLSTVLLCNSFTACHPSLVHESGCSLFLHVSPGC